MTLSGIPGDLLLVIILGIHGFLLMDGELAMDGDMIPIGPDIIRVITMVIMPVVVDSLMVELEDPIEPSLIPLEEAVVQETSIVVKKELPDREQAPVLQTQELPVARMR
jgi:hypothetical protein